MYIMFYIMKAKKIDKNNISTYITKITLIKIIVYLVLNLEICFLIISSFSGLVMDAMFLLNQCLWQFQLYFHLNDFPW